MDTSRLKALYDEKASQQASKEKQVKQDLANLSLQETVVKSIARLTEYLDGKVTKTIVVNQLQEIGTPDVENVVTAVDNLHETLKTHENTDLSEVTDALKGILEEAKKPSSSVVLRFETGLNFIGEYEVGKTYQVGEAVMYAGSMYVALMETDTDPHDVVSWQVAAEKGDKGDRGDQGIPGLQGLPGLKGEKGDPGERGLKGEDGKDGKDGRDGKDGERGPKGDRGLQGEKGDRGEQGFMGPHGPRGEDGLPGGPGIGVPVGGTTGQVLSKIDGTDYNTQWVAPGGGGGGIADPGSNGILARTALNTTVARTLTGTANQVIITNGDGVSGDPTFSLPQSIDTGATVQFGRVNTPQIANIVSANNSTMNFGNFFASITRNQADTEPVLKVIQTHASSTGDIIQFNNSSGNVLRVLRAGHLTPTTDSALTLGTSSLYWSNTYTDRLYLNSTAYLDGAVAGTANLTGSLGILATSGSATHSLTLGSTATGIALYNTVDQTTNYERVRTFWSGNVFNISGENGGTGTNRQMQIGTVASYVLYDDAYSSTYKWSFRRASVTSGGLMNITTWGVSMNGSSGVQTGLVIDPTLAQTSTAGYTMLLINPTETTTGSGTKLLADFQVGGVSKFKVDNTGKITSPLSQTYAITNVTTERAYDANATTLDEVADTLGTLIADLRSLGLVN